MTNQLFASDNASPVLPEVVEFLATLGDGHEISYGDDATTAAAERAIQELFGVECGVYFVYNGTGANVSALRAMAYPWQAIIATEMAHLNEDEGGAPEAIGGFKVLGVHREDGRLRSEDITPYLARIGFEHTSQPAVVALTEATEVGTIYRPAEVRAICEMAHEAGLTVHMDGARIANAAVTVMNEDSALGPREALRAITVDAGVDALSFGATKNGLMFGEAVVFFNRELERQYRFIRKQTTQLHSKMRYLAGQFIPYLREDLWVRGAQHANELARRLAAELDGLPGFSVALPVEANGVFVEMPARVLEALQDEFTFYTWNAARSMARLMISWNTREEFVEGFLARARELVAEVVHS